MKSFFAVFFVCILAFMPVFAGSDEPDQQTQAELLYELGLLKGTGKGLELSSDITREQSAVILVRLLGGEEEAVSGDFPCPFTDVKGWSAPYIGWLYEKGIALGVSEDRFAPRAIVTHEQYAAFLSRALGENYQNAPRYEFAPLTKKILTRGDAAELTVFSLGLRVNGSRLTLAQHLIHEGVMSEDIIYNAALPLLGENGIYGEGGILRRNDIGISGATGLYQEGGMLYRLEGEDKIIVDTGIDNEYPGWICIGIQGRYSCIFKQTEQNSISFVKYDMKTGEMFTVQSGFKPGSTETVDFYRDLLKNGEYGYRTAYLQAYSEYLSSVFGICRSYVIDENAVGFSGDAGLWHERGGRAYRLNELNSSSCKVTLVTGKAVLYKTSDGHYYAGINGDRYKLLEPFSDAGLTDDIVITAYADGVLTFTMKQSIMSADGKSGAEYTFVYQAEGEIIKCTDWSFGAESEPFIKTMLEERGISLDRLKNELIYEEQERINKIIG